MLHSASATGHAMREHGARLVANGYPIIPIVPPGDAGAPMQESSRGKAPGAFSEHGWLGRRGWQKGHVWVNGRHLGRFWHIGPQQTLYVPGCWLKQGRNEVIVLDLESTGRGSLAGLAKPVHQQAAAK